jgi:hypothetical protein
MKNAKVAAAAAIIAIGGAIGLQSVQVQARNAPNYGGLLITDEAPWALCKWIAPGGSSDQTSSEGAFESSMGEVAKVQGGIGCPPETAQ